MKGRKERNKDKKNQNLRKEDSQSDSKKGPGFLRPCLIKNVRHTRTMVLASLSLVSQKIIDSIK